MASRATSLKSAPPPLPEAAFADLLAKPAVARELLFPFGRARWQGRQYSLGDGRKDVASTISGVHFQEPDPNNLDVYRERSCQQDLVKLVNSVVELRKTPELANVVLSNEFPPARVEAGNSACRRGVFGLACPTEPLNENDAAAQCQRAIVAAGKNAGFVLRDDVPPYEPNNGFKGLEEWAARVRWRMRRFDRRWYWLLLLPLLFIPLYCALQDNRPRFFDEVIETESLIIVLDKSRSMTGTFPKVRDEAKRFLAEFKKRKRNPHVDLIYFDAEATSVLKGLKPLDDANEATLLRSLDALQPDKGTELEKAMQLAAKEIGEHKKPTTILVLTDGTRDDTIPRMQGALDTDQMKGSAFEPLIGQEAVMRWRTPRLMEVPPIKPNAEQARDERGLGTLSNSFNDRFWPKGKSGGGGPGGGGAGTGGGGAGSGGGGAGSGGGGGAGSGGGGGAGSGGGGAGSGGGGAGSGGGGGAGSGGGGGAGSGGGGGAGSGGGGAGSGGGGGAGSGGGGSGSKPMKERD